MKGLTRFRMRKSWKKCKSPSQTHLQKSRIFCSFFIAKSEQSCYNGIKRSIRSLANSAPTTPNVFSENGRIDAKALGRLASIPLEILERAVHRSRATINRTPDAPSMQEPLQHILAVIMQLQDLFGGEMRRVKTWLNAPNRELNYVAPLQVIAEGNVQVLRSLLHIELTSSRTVSSLTHNIKAYEEQLRVLGVDRLIVFGSFARGEQRPDSDCDILVHFGDTKRGGYFDLGRIKALLEKGLGLEVDVEFEDCVPVGHPLWRDVIHVF